MRGTLDKIERREWLTFENEQLQIFGVLHRPICCENPPIVVVFHGFASSKHGSNRCYVKLAEYLAEAGIATLRFDFRGSGDSEGNLTDMTFEDLISDGITVLNNLDSIDGIDANRVAIFGASLGGAVAILAAEQIRKIKAMALWAPVASGQLWLRDFLTHHPEYSRINPSELLSSFRGIKIHPLFREQFGSMAAAQALRRLPHIPLLAMQGERDLTISIAHQEALKEACGSRADVSFVKYPDGEHSLGFSHCFPSVCETTLSWLQKYL